MTDTLREREVSEEAKFKLDEERRFRIMCRRNKLFGLWAAKQLGKTGADAETYAKALVMLLLDTPDENAVVAKVLADLQAAEIEINSGAIADRLALAYTQAAEELANEWHALANDHVPVGG